MNKEIRFVTPKKKSFSSLDKWGIPYNCCPYCTLTTCKDKSSIRCSTFIYNYDKTRLQYDKDKGFSFTPKYLESISNPKIDTNEEGIEDTNPKPTVNL